MCSTTGRLQRVCPKVRRRLSPAHPTDTCGSAPRKAWHASTGCDSRYSTAVTSLPSPTSISPFCSSMGMDGCGSERVPVWPSSRRGDSGPPNPLPGSSMPTSARLSEAQQGRVWVGTENGFFAIAGANTRIRRCAERIAGRAHPCALGGPRRGAVGRQRRRSATLRRQALRHGRAARHDRGYAGHCHPRGRGRHLMGGHRNRLAVSARRRSFRHGSAARALRLGDPRARARSRRQPVDWHTRRRPGEVARRQVQRAGQQRVRQQRCARPLGGPGRKPLGRQLRRRAITAARRQVRPGRGARGIAGQPDLVDYATPGRGCMGRVRRWAQQLCRRPIHSCGRAPRPRRHPSARSPRRQRGGTVGGYGRCRRLPARCARQDRVRSKRRSVGRHGDGARRGPFGPHLDRHQ